MPPNPLLPWRALSLGTFLLAVCLPAAAAEPETDDPVEGLRQALRQDQAPAPGALKFRKENVEKYAAAIRTVPDLGRALLLREWRYRDLDPDIAQADRDAWSGIARRFKAEARKALHSPDPERARAAVTLVGEMATLLQGAGIRTEEVERALADFVPDLKDLSESDNAALRTTALRTLGRLGLQAQGVLPVLRRALEKDGVPQRRAAADALVTLIRTAAQNEKEGRSATAAAPPGENPVPRVIPPPPAGAGGPGPATPGFQAHPRGLIEASAQVVPVVAVALKDPDAAVRRLGAEAIHQAAQNLTDSVLLPVALDFPPPGRPRTAEERNWIGAYRAEVQEERKLLAPLAQVLGEQVPALGRAVADADLSVGKAAGRAVEALAAAHRKLLRRAASVPAPAGKEDGEGRPGDTLGKALKEAVPVLARRLSADDVRARLAALYALESLGAEATPASGEVVQALRDKDPFVRWGAARALGQMTLKGEAAGKAVAGLAPLLKDDNADVRLGAATALRRCGAAARGAVGPLSAAVKEGDEEVRREAIAALAGLGPAAGAEAVAALTAALKADEPEIRVAAAGALGKVGPADKAAREALQKALDDPDADVRLAASRALLQGEGGRP